MGKPKLKIRKPILNVVFNEKEQAFFVELGKHITDENVFVSIVFIIETLAEKMDISKESAWTMLEVYRKGRISDK